MNTLTQKQTDRFWSHVNKLGECLCWEWTAFRDKAGYGRVCLFKKNWMAHRVSWTIMRGEIPAGLDVLHRCDNTCCCNPRHLFLGTDKDNVADKMRKGRARGATGEANSHAKLTEAIILDLRKEYPTAPRGWIARTSVKYGIARQTLRKALVGENWGHLSEIPVSTRISIIKAAS